MADRNDPLPAFVFKVTLNISGEAVAFFKTAGGLSFETEVVPVKEGGVNRSTWQIVGATKWKNITLKRGFTSDSKLIQWRQDWMNGTSMVRQSGTVTQLNGKLEEVAKWDFQDGWPSKWEISEFDASKNEVAIETLEIAHHGLKYTKLK